MKTEYIKAMLYLYPHCNEETDKLLTFIPDFAVKTMDQTLTTEEIFDTIIDLQEKAVYLRNLKNQIDLIIKHLDEKSVFCLYKIFFNPDPNGHKCKSCICNYNCATGCSKHMSRLIKKVDMYFGYLGVTDEFFEKNLLPIKRVRACLRLARLSRGPSRVNNTCDPRTIRMRCPRRELS